MSGRRLDVRVPAAAQPRASVRRGSLPVGSLAGPGGSAMSTWKIPGSNQPPHAQDDSVASYGGGAAFRPPRPFPHASLRAHDDAPLSRDMKFIHRLGAAGGKYPQGVHKIVPPTTGFNLKAAARAPSPVSRAHAVASTTAASHADVRLPDGTLHVWVYQARHLVFRRLFETMYERHGLRLRVYAGSRTTQDVGEIYETRRNYGGNMANPRWRRDQDDARDDAHGHFSIPLARASLRTETELTVEIVCGILVVAHTKVSLPALFLGSFGTTIESLAAHNVQFRPHWFPLAGEDAGLIEMALEFIPTRIVKEQQEQQRQASPQQQQQPPSPPPAHSNNNNNNQPESEYDVSEYDDESVIYDQQRTYHPASDLYDQYDQHAPPLQVPPRPQNVALRSRSSPDDRYVREKEADRQRAREYEALERQEQLRRQRFEMLEDPHETRPLERARSATTASSSSSSSARSTRFVVPRGRSYSDREDQEDLPYYHQQHYQQHRPPQPQYDFEDQYYEHGEVVIMDSYDESSPPPSEFSGYELHDSRYDQTNLGNDDVGYDAGQFEPRTSMGSDYYDDVSMSASSSWASVSTVNDSSQENLQNKQLWDLYRYGISDEAPEEIDTSRRGADSVDSSLRDSAMSMSSVTSSMVSRKMSTMSQASDYSIAFSDASEASMFSREASTCASEILTYNDRIQRMEEAIRLARERRQGEEGAPAPAPQQQPQQQPQPSNAQTDAWKRPQAPAPISTAAPARPPASLTAFGWERPTPALASPATSEPVMLDSRKGVVLFDMDHIPVKGHSGQTDPALEAYRAKMLARRRSLPIHMLSGAGAGGIGVGAMAGMHGPHGGRGGAIPPHLSREVSAPAGRGSLMRPEPSWPVARGRAQPKYDPHAREPARWDNNQQSQAREQAHARAVDSPLARVPSWQLKKSHEEPARSSRSNESERNSTSSIDFPGPPGLRRKRSSSLHSISDLLRDQSFRIHNIVISSSPDAKDAGSQQAGRAPSRQSVSDHSVGRSSSGSGERKLSKASSYASSDASSSGQQVVPSGNASTASSAPRVRRNSKGGGNVVQINGIALGIGKFINVGNVPGVIRYIGPTMFAPGQWIGIELVEKKGKHNGTVQNVQYFECAPDHGIFIRAERLDISA